MDPRKALLIEIKRTAGLATAAEIDALESAPVEVGQGLIVPRPSRDVDQWFEQFSAVVGPQDYAQKLWDDGDAFDHQAVMDVGGDDEGEVGPATPPPAPRGPTRTASGLILCAPGDEPPPAGRPDYRPAPIGQRAPWDGSMARRLRQTRRA